MNDEADDAFGDALEARLRGTGIHDRSESSDIAPSELDALLDVADLLWEAAHGAPPLSSDPTAAMLGLVPDTQYVLDPGGLKRLRSNASMKPSELARRLRERGWRFQTRDVVRWESRRSEDLAPALIRAIAGELGVNPDNLASAGADGVPGVSTAGLTASSKFALLVDRWAVAQRIPISMARSALESRVIATAHRGDRPDNDQLLQSLEALVETIEESSGRNDDS